MDIYIFLIFLASVYLMWHLFKSLFMSRCHTLSPSSPVSQSFFTLAHSLTGQPSSRSIKHARWLVVTTTSQAACSSPGLATIRAGSPPTRHASTSGMPCRMYSHTVPIHPSSSLMRKCPDHMEYVFSFFTFYFLHPLIQYFFRQ